MKVKRVFNVTNSHKEISEVIRPQTVEWKEVLTLLETASNQLGEQQIILYLLSE